MCFKSADPLGLARRLMLPLLLSPSPPEPKNLHWGWDCVLNPPQNSIIFQVSFSIAIKIDFEPHLGSILASIGTQKHWFLMGVVSKINILTFCILNIIWTRFSINFDLLGASKIDQKILWSNWGGRILGRFRVPRCSQAHILTLNYPRSSFKTCFWCSN